MSVLDLTPSPPPQPVSEPSEALVLEEAARYALLRRLMPAIRHHLVGEFQPIGMIAAMMERRLQAATPNLVSLRDNSSMLGELSRTAAGKCTDLLTWIAPPKNASTRLDAGVLDCLNVLSTEFRLGAWSSSMKWATCPRCCPAQSCAVSCRQP